MSKLTFNIPGFFSAIHQQGGGSDFPVLTKMLAKAAAEAGTKDELNMLCEQFKLGNDFQPPVAAIMQYSATEKSHEQNQWICCASPVMIVPNRDHLDLVQSTGFDISEDEASRFCDEFNDYFKEDGLSFSYTAPDKWFCHAKTPFNVPSTAPFAFTGGDIAPYVPRDAESTQWRRLFNETQMLLHHSATNRSRSVLGKPEINSLWFWGGGCLNPSFDAVGLSVYSDDDFTLGLARLTQSHVFPLSADFQANDFRNDILVSVDAFCKDYDGWDERYFLPALQLLKSGKVDQINFFLGSEKSYVLRKPDLLRFWKKHNVFQETISD